jgi:fructose/tagatose bisphosphate aldolase
VEGEIGAIGRADLSSIESGFGESGLGESGLGLESMLTAPVDAAAYVRDTGVDLLAVSIGNAHGMYTKSPHLNFDLLGEIRRLVDVPLVLHGGSGTPEQDVQRAISLGMAKVNVASELVQSVRESLMRQWGAGENLYAPFALARAMKDMSQVVKKWIMLTGASGKAEAI